MIEYHCRALLDEVSGKSHGSLNHALRAPFSSSKLSLSEMAAKNAANSVKSRVPFSSKSMELNRISMSSLLIH